MENNHKPVLIVIAGPNGSGKTTVTEQILRHEWMEDAIYINPDIVAQERFGDWNSSDAVKKSVAYCEALREKSLVEGKSLIFETVLSRKDKVDYIRRAKEAGFFVRVFFVCTESPTINASRIARRVMQGGHDVPISKIISRYNLSIANCLEVARIVDRCYLYDNSVENSDARPIFRIVDGKVFKIYSTEIPDWADAIMSRL